MFGRKKDEFRLEIDMVEYNALKIELLDLIAEARVVTGNANLAADKLKAVNRDLSITLDKILAAKRR